MYVVMVFIALEMKKQLKKKKTKKTDLIILN